jgi:Tol biopolymer transport system component
MVEKEMVLSSFDPMRGRLAEVARIDAPHENLTWSLSPDGSRIALVENLTDNVRILDLRTKETHVIHPIPPHNGLQFSAWSADGQRLFLTGFPVPRGQLLEMDMQGHAHLLLENRHGWIGYPLPSPDGKRIAYRSVIDETNVMLLEHF